MIDIYTFLFLAIFFIVMNFFILWPSIVFGLTISSIFTCCFIGLYFSLEQNLVFTPFAIIILCIEFIFIVCLTNISRLQHFYRKGFFFWKNKSNTYERDDLIKKICDAMKYLAKENCGALILIQNKDDLVSKFINNTKEEEIAFINAPVTEELLECIFYTGNRLHDGAVIIRDNIIVAANVFIPVTEKTRSKKFGARHTAAFNASEETDATVILLSEEQKKLTIFHNNKKEKEMAF